MNRLSVVQMVLLFVLSLSAAGGMVYVLRRFFGQLTAIERARWGESAEVGSTAIRNAFRQLLALAKPRKEKKEPGETGPDKRPGEDAS